MNVRVILLSAAVMMTLALLAGSPSSKVESAPGEYMEVVSFDTGVECSKAPLPADESARFNPLSIPSMCRACLQELELLQMSCLPPVVW